VNKAEFIKALTERLPNHEDTCVIIADVLENNFFISKKNRDKIIEEFILKLDAEKDEAEKIYNTAIEIIKDELKYKLKHPFK